VTTAHSSSGENHAIASFDDARAAVAHGVTPEDAARALTATMSAEERLWCLDGDAPSWAGLQFLGEDGYHRAPFRAALVERIGLPGIAFSDGPRGCVIGNTTCFPVTMARGATWDPVLEERIGDAIGRELRASGATLTGAVCVNLLRHPAWGRAQETYGEDPHHVGELGAALTRGLQRHVMACVKHFACNSMENARFAVDVEVDDVALHEVYLPHFRRIVQEGVASVMSAYNSVNGDWAGQNAALLTDVLRQEWGFRGFVISDWIFGLRDAAKSLRAGLGIEMPYRMVRAQHLPGALERGEASWADVDESVTRLIATLLRFDPVLGAPPPEPEVIGCAAHRDLARLAAARSTVVLRNDDIDGAPLLPLDPTVPTSVAVLGRLADEVNLGDSGSSDVWANDCRTVWQGMRQVFADGVLDDGADLDRAVAVAQAADVAVVVAGYTYLDEGEFIGGNQPELLALFPPADEAPVVARFQAEIAAVPPIDTPAHVASRGSGVGFAKGGDRTSLRLHAQDVALIRAVAAVNRRTIVVVQAGSAVIVDEWCDDVAAVVLAWYGGSEAGTGLADVLTGAVNPSARLPFSMVGDESHLPTFDRDARHTRYDRWHGWWHLEHQGHTPAYPFGFGLSYTTFALTSAAVSRSEGNLSIRGTLANTGRRDGADVVQVYAELPVADRPGRLVGFTRVEVAAGASVPFDVTVPLERLAIRHTTNRSWLAPRGPHRLVVGRHVGDRHALVVDVEL
jgi:beta-glucosidase